MNLASIRRSVVVGVAASLAFVGSAADAARADSAELPACGYQMVSILNGNGIREAFGVGSSHDVLHEVQEPGSNLVGVDSFEADAYCTPAVTMNVNRQVHVFVLGADQGIWAKWQKTAGRQEYSDNWYSMGIPPAYGNVGTGNGSYLTGANSSPGAILDDQGLMELFVRGFDGAIWTRWQTSAGGGWSDWASLQGNCDSRPAVGVDGSSVTVVCETGGIKYYRRKAYVGAGWTWWAEQRP